MSGLPFELLLALRYLRPKRTFVSVITLISVLGVTLGVAVLIIVISVMTGFDRQLRDKILGFNTHIKIFNPDRSMSDYQRWMRVVSSNRNVKAVAPFVLGQVLLETEPNGQSRIGAPWVRGLDPALETNLTILPSNIIAGAFDVTDRGLVLGSELAHNLGLHVGERVRIYSPRDLRKWRESSGKEGEKIPAPPEYDVRGVFDVGYFEYNASMAVTSLEDAQDLYDLNDTVHGLMVMLRDPSLADQTAAQLAAATDHHFRIRTWMEENENILSALVVEKNVMFYLLFFIMIVAALCILSALITFVVQKTREIGMLKALGATDLQVSLIFLSQGGLVGGLGVSAGYFLGRVAIAYRNEFLEFMRHATHWELFPAEVYGFDKLPAMIVPRDILLICGSALIICVLGGVIPAWRAGRLKPVAALRYE